MFSKKLSKIFLSLFFLQVFLATNNILWAYSLPNLIYKDSLGEELIVNFVDISEGIIEELRLEKLLGENDIILSSIQKQANLCGKQIHIFNGKVEDYKISSNLQHLAFYSSQEGCLSIIDLKTGALLWKEKMQHPLFQWHPLKQLLTIGEANESRTLIYNIDLISKKMFPIIELENTFLHQIQWSPNGELLGIIKLQGMPESQSYSQLEIYNQKGNILDINNIPDINYMNWSPNNLEIVFSQYGEVYSSSKVGFFDIPSNTVTYLPQNFEKTINPIYSNDANSIYFSVIEGFSQKVVSYDINKKEFTIFCEEPRYVSDLALLNNHLLFTFGSFPQIKIIEDYKEASVIDGLSPQVVQNILFYVKNENDNSTLLMEYKIDLQAN
ncbi:MAG: hypothetical protein ACOYVD_15885 [Bacillota bacterium]